MEDPNVLAQHQMAEVHKLVETYTRWQEDSKASALTFPHASIAYVCVAQTAVILAAVIHDLTKIIEQT